MQKSFEILRKLVVFLLIALPLINYIQGNLALLTYGIDIPLHDEWRNYTTQHGAFYYITVPLSDTLSPIGFLLEGLVQRFLGGNTVTHRFLSMSLLLGGLLWIQWQLISLVTPNTLLKAAFFSLSIFILQSESYWGYESVNGYVQGIPLLCCMSILYLVLKPGIRLCDYFFMVCLAFISGFSYLSGAFALVSLMLSFLFFFWAIQDKQSLLYLKLRTTLTILSLPVLITLIAQLYAIYVSNGNSIGRSAYPFDPNFWLFILGKIARALALSPSVPALMTASAVLLLTLGLLIYIVYTVITRPPKQLELHMILMTTILITGVYIMIVAYGRTYHVGAQDMNYMTLFSVSFIRVHFFWLTILWSWIVIFLVSRLNLEKKYLDFFFGLCCLVGVCFIQSLPKFDHFSFFRTLRVHYMDGYHCLSELTYAFNDDLKCQRYRGAINTIKDGVNNNLKNAEQMGATFFDHIKTNEQIYNQIMTTSTNKTILFQASADNGPIKELNNFPTNQLLLGQPIEITSYDPQIYIMPDKTAMARCQAIEFTALINSSNHNNDYAQIFYLPTGVSEFHSNYAQVHLLHSGIQKIQFIIRSHNGFNNIFRFDPVSAPQEQAIIEEMTMNCLKSMPH